MSCPEIGLTRSEKESHNKKTKYPARFVIFKIFPISRKVTQIRKVYHVGSMNMHSRKCYDSSILIFWPESLVECPKWKKVYPWKNINVLSAFHNNVPIRLSIFHGYKYRNSWSVQIKFQIFKFLALCNCCLCRCRLLLTHLFCPVLLLRRWFSDSWTNRTTGQLSIGLTVTRTYLTTYFSTCRMYKLE